MIWKYAGLVGALLLGAALSAPAQVAAQQDYPTPAPGLDPAAGHLMLHSGVAYLLQDCKRDLKRTTCEVQLTSPSPGYDGAWFVQGSYCIDQFKVRRAAVDLHIARKPSPDDEADFPVLRAEITVSFAGIDPEAKQLKILEIAGNDGIPFSLHYTDIAIADAQESTKTASSKNAPKAN